jgi:hypothetical protein
MLRVAFVKDLPGETLDDPEFVKLHLRPPDLSLQWFMSEGGKVHETVPRPLSTRS